MRRSFLFVFLSFASLLSASPIPADAKVLILAVPANWNSTHTRLQAYRRVGADHPWTAWTPAFEANLGRNGLAWGRGCHPAQEGPQKREGDLKSPAGVFQLGSILYGSEEKNPLNGWRYRRVTDRDLWIEDPQSTNYNRHLILSAHEEFPANHLFDRMRQNDPAHALKIFIRHNAPPGVQPGAGSAIFFHLSRGTDHPTTGCTTLLRADFETLFGKCPPEDHPIYVLLPLSSYLGLRSDWGLPENPP